MTTLYCAHCRQSADVRRYRMADVGLRWICDPCRAVLEGLGMHIIAVPDTDPRAVDRGRHARRHLGIGRRLALRWRAVA